MKRYYVIFVFSLFVVPSIIAQSSSFVVGIDGFAAFPLGEFSKRLKSSNGFAVSLREGHYNNARWGGYFEYNKFDDENKEKLFIKRKDTLQNVPRDLVIPLKSFDMSFTSAGAGVTANYNIFSTSFVDVNGSAGFGIYYWKFDRSAYFDSVKVDTGSVVPKFKLIDIIQVPELHQHDWSGGFDVGLETEVTVFSPFIVSAGVRYKIILSELWPTLALDLENVSGIQSAYFSVGLKFIFE